MAADRRCYLVCSKFRTCLARCSTSSRVRVCASLTCFTCLRSTLTGYSSLTRCSISSRPSFCTSLTCCACLCSALTCASASGCSGFCSALTGCACLASARLCTISSFSGLTAAPAGSSLLTFGSCITCRTRAGLSVRTLLYIRLCAIKGCLGAFSRLYCSLRILLRITPRPGVTLRSFLLQGLGLRGLIF